MITKEVVIRATSENFVIIDEDVEDDEEDEDGDVGYRGKVSPLDEDMALLI